ncbi:uncharacterized protein KY384_008132 [Bacidia gigantensis]|uniref:uncharacterized protein n=1 Tax=Bacidia gigantensis TaxID=2732470 RepID=UPI001D057E1B|nr:uncharacterized protein KY384_008132 [Bacidia gigantensis]KAG8526703.1 hypothetical protein KY384_008132 [Bacidia gigantensis]
MSAQASSIQSYFQRENCNPGTGMQRNTTAGGDSTSSAKGPTPSEKWQPRSQYTEKQIRDLKVGPGNVSVTGRVVNFYEQTSRGKSPLAAKGSLKIVVKDDSGAITVKLWYANKIYALKLGDLVTIWTHHISNPENSSPTIQHASLVTSMFPERDNTSYFQIQGNVPGYSGKTPLGYRFGFPMPGLVTLKNFIDGAHEVTNMSILVCVRSIGVMKNCKQ